MKRPPDHTTERYLRDLRDAARARRADAVAARRQTVDPTEADGLPSVPTPPPDPDGA